MECRINGAEEGLLILFLKPNIKYIAQVVSIFNDM